MKIQLTSHRGQQGTALLVALFLTTILAVTIAGYLKHAQQQNYLSMRSQSWNMVMAITEAGIEEAMQHISQNSNNLAVDGWSQSGSEFVVERNLSTSARYRVQISLASGSEPQITCQAFVAPGIAAKTAPDFFFATLGLTSGEEDGKSDEISRAVRVRLAKKGMFSAAMVAKHKIDINGNDVHTDSFNSADPNYSTNGMYTPSKARDRGDVASNDNVQNAVNLGNGNIYGRVRVGPGGTVYVGPNGGVGTRLWQTFNNGIQSGYFSDDMNFTFPTVTLPYGDAEGISPSSGSATLITNFTVSSQTTTTAGHPGAGTTGVVTNQIYKTVSALPTPIPYGTVTNYTTSSTLTASYPAEGTYIGTVEVVNKKYRYNKIIGRTFTYPSYTYTYSTTTTNMAVTSVGDYDYVFVGTSATEAPRKFFLSSMPSGDALIMGNVQLVVAGNVTISGTDSWRIATDGKLEMWAGGTSVNLNGNGVMNDNGYAMNFMLWCTDDVTSMSLNGNGEFTGVLVAPNADLKLNGGGYSVTDFVGALITKTVTMNGNFDFHYDEALEGYRNNGRFTLEAWDEIPINQLNLTRTY
jgi:hypothetical protein